MFQTVLITNPRPVPHLTPEVRSALLDGARRPVEHGVTEDIHGIDLVKRMIRSPPGTRSS